MIESMKMQTVLPSPVDGVIKSLGRRPGSAVAEGDVLAGIGK